MPKKKQPPAKIRYDNTHPIVSIRVSRDLKKQLDEIKRTSGKNVADILREALKVQAPSIKKAYEQGIIDGRNEYGVIFKCSGCGEGIWIKEPELKKAATEYMEKYGWGHKECGVETTHIEFWGVPDNLK